MTGPKLAAKSAKKPKSAGNRPRRSPEAIEANREASAKRMRAAYQAMSPAERALQRFRKQAKPPVPRKGSVRAAHRRAGVIADAFCDWSDIEEVVRLYVAAAVMCELTGLEYVVDHIVPLQHPLVCGLHTHTNLQVITGPLNRLKGNWIWPGMWPPDETTIGLLEQLAEQQDRLEAANDEHPRTATA